MMLAPSLSSTTLQLYQVRALGKRADKGFISPMGIVYPINSESKASAGAPGLAGDWGAFGIFGFYVRRTLEVRRT